MGFFDNLFKRNKKTEAPAEEKACCCEQKAAPAVEEKAAAPAAVEAPVDAESTEA